MQRIKRLLTAINPGRSAFRWALHAVWIIALSAVFIYLNTGPPFLAVSSNSMEPAISRGDLIISRGVTPGRVQTGDVIIFNVSPVFQEKYGYPATLCHRVVRVQNTEGKLFFRTRGDNNASDDPFMTPAQNLIGQQKSALPWLGYAVMYIQSSQGKLFFGGLIVLFLFYQNSGRLMSGLKKVHKSMAGISPQEFNQSQNELDRKLNDMTDRVTQSMNGFSAAVTEYARHIESHTGPNKSLAQAAGHMESILSKQDAALEKSLKQAENQAAVKPSIFMPASPPVIEVTPELKAAVKEFIRQYCEKNGITSLEITPELREAVWNYILEFSQNRTLPPPGAYKTAIKKVKIQGDLSDLENVPETVSPEPQNNLLI